MGVHDEPEQVFIFAGIRNQAKNQQRHSIRKWATM
jgi:hypothetical protein